MIKSPLAIGTNNHCAGEGQQGFISQSVLFALISTLLVMRLEGKLISRGTGAVTIGI
jgi:hypothetical protein